MGALMARKNLLKGLMEQPEKLKSEPKSDSAPRYKKGAIGAVSKQIEELKSRSIVELDPFAIKAGGLSDRLEHDEPDHKILMDSLQTYGQQVPVLVRPDPENENEFLIVYGRRRVLALRDLGLPVKAMIRDLDDDQAIMAQGQENSARRDLSFIERVNFARQMDDAGYDRKVICDALSTDKTLISRMLKIADTVPVELIESIGAAHGIGRDRWVKFADLWTKADADLEAAMDMRAVVPGQGSDAVFEDMHNWLERRVAEKPKRKPKPKRPPATPLVGPNGKFGQFSKQGDSTKITLSGRKSGGFDKWLIENIEEIHQDWLKHQDGE